MADIIRKVSSVGLGRRFSGLVRSLPVIARSSPSAWLGPGRRRGLPGAASPARPPRRGLPGPASPGPASYHRDETPIMPDQAQRCRIDAARAGRATATMGHRCCGNNIDGPPLRLVGRAEQHRWPIDAVLSERRVICGPVGCNRQAGPLASHPRTRHITHTGPPVPSRRPSVVPERGTGPHRRDNAGPRRLRGRPAARRPPPAARPPRRSRASAGRYETRVASRVISGTLARARLTGQPALAACACLAKATSSRPGTLP